MERFSKNFDHTLLKADARQTDILKLCRDAAEYEFASVCVNSSYVAFAAKMMEGTGVDVTSVIGFPLGAMSSDAKTDETVLALDDGASEIDMVINIGALKDGRYDYIADEISTLATLCHESEAILKVIIETCLLTDDEIRTACILAERGGADFVKTSTGFSTGGATLEDVKLIKEVVGDDLLIKASGGIRTLADAKAMLEAGADRLGCSASVEIMEEYLKENE